MSMWRRRFLSLDITALCSGAEQSGKMLDGVAEGEVRSETGEKSAFRERDNTKKDKRLCPQDNQAVKEAVNVKARAEVEAADADHRTVSA